MDRDTITNLELLWKLLVYHNKPMHFKVIYNYLIQFMSKHEIYKTIRDGLNLALIDRTGKNQLILSKTSVLRGKNHTLIINPSLNDIKQLQETNTQTEHNPISGIVILSHKNSKAAIEYLDAVNYNFQNLCRSVGKIMAVLNQLKQIDSEAPISGYPFDPFSNSFSKDKKNINGDLVLFEHKININYSKYFLVKDSVLFVLPENNLEVLDCVKLLTQLTLPSKFNYSRQNGILHCRFCTIPFFIERVLSMAHIMKCGEISTERKYNLSLDELNILNKIVFETRLNISYE